MELDLAWTWPGAWFFDKVDFVSGIVERCDIGIRRWCLIWPEDAKRGVIKDLARIIDACETAGSHCREIFRDSSFVG